ncbi:MAG: hypothetical protein JWO82_2723 [Akkermansiaceae bacterium]|nr:hypothetical protein [Akkermansiaceae bacterium]
MKGRPILWSVIAAAIVAALFFTVQKVDQAHRAQATASGKSQTPADASTGSNGRSRPASERSARSQAPLPALSDSPDGRFQAEGNFVATPNRASFRLKPFAISQKSDSFAWTSANGRDPAILHELAHNDLEEDRLSRENAWVEKRQLVYCDDYISNLGNSVANAPADVKSIKLPGFDGQEYDIDVDRTDSPQGAMEWNIAGHLKDRPDTLVSISTVHGYTAIVFITPELYIEGDAREPGEVVLNQINRQARRDAKPKNAIAGVNPFNVGEPEPPPAH